MVAIGDILMVENPAGFFILAEVVASEYDTDKVFLNPCFTPIWEAKSADRLAEIVNEIAALLLAATSQPPFAGETFSLEGAYDDEGDYQNTIPYYQLTGGVLAPWEAKEDDDEGEE
jgi:hypothetical protein